MRIEKRQTFWKKKEYKVVDSGEGWTIERLTIKPTNAPDLNEMLRKALRKKRYKWE